MDRWDELEQGSVVPAVAGMIAALVAFGLAVAAAGLVYVTQVKAQMTADLAAIAAASQAPSALWGHEADAAVACAFAQEVTLRNGGKLRDCWADQGDIRLVVTQALTWQGIPWEISAKARAGPVGN